MHERFRRFAAWAAAGVGSPTSFVLHTLVVSVWLLADHTSVGRTRGSS